ncbi:MAG: glycosyltransferase [Candidatus Saccharicenans sp.]
MIKAFVALLTLFSAVVLLYFFSLNLFYVIFTVLSLSGLIHHQRNITYVTFRDIFRLPGVKPFSVIVPAYNEEKTIIESVRSFLSLEYPLYEVIVVNDGSRDATLEKLIRHFRLEKSKRVFRRVLKTENVRGIYLSPDEPRLVVVDKENGGKADALNAGLNVSRYPLFCAVDSDSLLERDALLKMVRPFLEDPERVVAAGGVIRLSNGCRVEGGQVREIRLPRNVLARFQIVEYLRAFLGGRMGLSMLRSLLIISGAFGAFRKDVVMECGGYRRGTVGEDVDLVVRLVRYLREKKRTFAIRFVPDPICWTEAPETIKILSRQRNRWHRGLIETVAYNRKMLFNPRYGLTGMFALPFYFIYEMLGPVIEVAGYAFLVASALLGILNYPFALLFFLLAVFMGVIVSLMSVLISEYSWHRYPRLSDVLNIILFSFLENFFYRQYLALVRARAFVDYFRRVKTWGEMTRKGFYGVK